MDFYQALPILFGSGIFAGFYAASVGSGALVAFPVMLLTGLPVHSAVGSTRFAALMQTASSSTKYFREGKTDINRAMKFGISASIGSIFGAQLTVAIDEKHLSIAAAVLIGFFTLFSIFKRKLGQESSKKKRPATPTLYLGTLLLGIYGGFFGAGFGTVLTFVFLYQGYNFVESAANSRTVGFMISLVSSIIFAINGLIYFQYAIPMGIGQAIGGWLGAKTSIKKGNQFVRHLFILIAIITMTKLVWSNL